MPMYSEDIINEISSRIDIVDVISPYVSLKKKGNTYFGLCPFHNEKTPSFSVSPGKQMFYCFGCGKGGNAFTFLMQHENMTFPEAIEYLAEKAGVELPKQEMTAEQRAFQNKKSQLFEVQKEAAKYFYYLMRDERGKSALEYFKGRGLSEETMQKFGLGYSDKRSDDLYHYLKSKGFSDDVLKDSGVITIDERRGGHDKFWNRAMFPIMDQQKRVIAFGGRVMGDGEPKYLNSPETPIFDKSRTLYGLHIARSTKRNAFILCEGYMDVIALHQAGFDNAVASLGTAFTPGHAALIKRFVSEVYLSFDSDGAGTKAKLRAIPILKAAGITCKIINMEPHKDPDEFIKALGPSAYEERIRNAENSFMFTIRILERDYNMSDPTSKTAFFKEVAGRIVRFPDELERSNYIEAVASKYGIRQDEFRQMVIRLAAEDAVNPGNGYEREEYDEAPQVKKRPMRDKASEEAQKLLLTWISEEPFLLNGVGNYIKADDFAEGILRITATHLFDQIERDALAPSTIVNLFDDEEEQQEVASIFHATVGELESPAEKAKALREVVMRVKRDSFKRQKEEMAESDPNIVLKTMEEKKLQKELENIDFYDISR
ncbi:MAG: DNA primase [Lachnospiraceae bacterium]|nr:DNA primase [Lachnospiraceae bacterium]